MKNVHQVALLFNAKARSWSSKYSADGPLAFRVDIFSELLAQEVRLGAAVLDFGGGTGHIASALARDGFRMTVCDISEEMIRAGKQAHSDQGVEWCLLPEDWKRLPFQNESFDAIVASSTFEYLDEVDGVLAECARILAPGGKLIFSVPNPAHLSRQLERYFRMLAMPVSNIPFVRRLPKIGSYLTYLCVSRSRFSEEQWKEKALAADLRPSKGHKPKTIGNSPMLYLVFANESPAPFRSPAQ